MLIKQTLEMHPAPWTVQEDHTAIIREGAAGRMTVEQGDTEYSLRDAHGGYFGVSVDDSALAHLIVATVNAYAQWVAQGEVQEAGMDKDTRQWLNDWLHEHGMTTVKQMSRAEIEAAMNDYAEDVTEDVAQARARGVEQMIAEAFTDKKEALVFDPPLGLYPVRTRRDDGFVTLGELNAAGWALTSVFTHPSRDVLLAVFTR